MKTLLTFFSLPRPSRLRRPASGPDAFDVPAGEILLSVTRIVGKANREVISSLDLADAGEIWLEANLLEPHSRWPARILSRDIWGLATGHRSALLSHTMSIEPNEIRRFTFESPRLPGSP